MLNVPTLWTVFVINFLALGLIWAYITRSYPAFDAARLWTGSAFFAAAGGAAATARAMMTESVVPLLAAGTLMVFASCLSAMGIQRFYGKPVSWRGAALLTGLNLVGLAFFTFVHDSTSWRIIVYTLAHGTPMALTLPLLFSRQNGRINPGARLAGVVSILVLALFAFRLGGNLYYGAAAFSFVRFTPAQSVLILVLVFLAMSTNFGFLLMAMDRLRNEVADLALMDDLTGFANRRHLLQRLTEECGNSMRSGEPFTLLVIDLDGFKAINDTHGHAAGDACLQHFTLMAQTRLRPGDMLARSGGDEFCIVLPASTLREGEMIAGNILEVCRADAARCSGNDIPISVSIGVAQWTRDIGDSPDRLIAAADHALYDAKKRGRNGFSSYGLAPSLAPEMADALVLRKRA